MIFLRSNDRLGRSVTAILAGIGGVGLLIGLAAAFFWLTGKDSSPSGKALDTVQAYYTALQAEDLEAAKNTLHNKSPNYLSRLREINQLFEDYNLNYQPDSVGILFQSNEEILVGLRQTTTKKDDSDFAENETDLFHILRKDDETGNWMIVDTVIKEVRPVQNSK